MPEERNEGRRAADRERALLRALEAAVRNFVAHVEDRPREWFAPRTLALVDECRAVAEDLDRLRAARGRPRPEGG